MNRKVAETQRKMIEIPLCLRVSMVQNPNNEQYRYRQHTIIS